MSQIQHKSEQRQLIQKPLGFENFGVDILRVDISGNPYYSTISWMNLVAFVNG